MRSFSRRRRSSSTSLRPWVERCEARILLTVIPVTNTADTGAGSLRSAIIQADATSTPDVIQFAINGGGPALISPASPLPAITQTLTIDGTSQPGYSGTPLIMIDGTNAGFITDGLSIQAGGSVVQGLAIGNFGGNGIVVSNANNAVFNANYLGLNLNLASAPNQNDGIFVTGSSGTVIGQPGLGNVIGGNVGNGIHLGSLSSTAVIQANFIGTTSARSGIGLGSPNVPNQSDGIFLQGATGVTIGGTASGAGNVVSSNGFNGLDFAGGSANLILGNKIGTDASGLSARGNNGAGVLLGNSASNTIGGPTSASGNVIGSNNGNGITVRQARSLGNLIESNDIGVGLDGLTSLGNTGNGIQINAASNNSVVGNIVSGNNFAGVYINTPLNATSVASGNSIRGNLIGLNLAGNRVSNSTDGVFVLEGANNTIGGTSAADRNVISGNGGNGISFRGPQATGNLVQGNYIGTNATGQIGSLVGNIIDGVYMRNSPGNTVGGTAAGAGNVIAQNRIGIDIESYDTSELSPSESSLIPGRSDNNVIQGNKIGTDVTGNLPIGNYGEGILIADGSNNLIGGSAPSAGNLISANLVDGVSILSVEPALDLTSGNVVQGNTIGLTADGTNGIGNGQAGVRVTGGINTTVGGPAQGQGNVISGNELGVAIVGFTPGVSLSLLIQGNIIGLGSDGFRTDPTTPGYGSTKNTSDGIVLQQGASGVTVGGTAEGAGNVISNNASSGIRFASNSTGNLFEGNLIGVAKDGLSSRSNGLSGLLIASGSSRNTIGGTASNAGNVISGNSIGVTISNTGSSNNLFEGNLIGLGIDGSTVVGNVAYGFLLLNGAADNTIGGTNPGARNVISGNGQGITINGPAVEGTIIQGNFIGLDATGRSARGNDRAGIAFNNAAFNAIGGSAPGAGNVISGNGGLGVLLAGAFSTGNIIQGNLVGLDATGTTTLGLSGTSLGNAGYGITLDNAPNNTIGGTTPGAGNVVSGNRLAGIEINGVGSVGSDIQGNRIGTDMAGLLSLGNLAEGILLDNAPGIVIGGVDGHEANLISGNLTNGITIRGAGSVFDAIVGNLIGTDATGGGALGNGSDGIAINGAPGVTIGGTIATLRNVISSNHQNGVAIAGAGSIGTVVLGNLIGVDATGRGSLGNLNDGVFLNGATGVTIGGTAPGSTNVISSNLSSGVEFGTSTTTSNRVLGNLVGTDNLGTLSLPNSIGVFVNNAGFNQIGGTEPFSGNLISGNIGAGVEIFGANAIGNLIQGNRLGTNLAGLAALPNSAGVFIDGSASNVVGGQVNGSGNLISGNTSGGVVLQGTGATRNLIQGNLIGPDINGGKMLAASVQQPSGVLLTDAPSNVVGGTTAAARNVISGNVAGVVVAGFNAKGNLIIGNLVGLDATGRFAVPNSVGVYINGSSLNTIGGSVAGSSNVISGNLTTGITFFGAQTTLNVVAGNRIGTNLTGSLRVPNQEGIYIETSSANTIGGPSAAAGNLISGNSVAGVYLFSGSANNLIQNNRIGFTASGGALGNIQYGVLLYNAANNAVDTSSQTGNKIGNSGIGNFREFTGPVPTTTTTTTSTKSLKTVKKASHPAGPKALARR